MRSVLFWTAVAALLIGGYFTPRTAVPLQPAGILQVHRAPPHVDGQRPEQSKVSPDSLGEPLLRAAPEPARPTERHKPSEQQSQGQGQQTPSGDGWTGEIFPGFKVTDLINVSLTMSLVFLGAQQLRTYRNQAKIMEGQLEAATTAADAARTANLVSRESLIANRRPWVSIAISVGQRGLYFDVNGANLHLIFTMSNTGGTPAAYVQIIGGPSLTTGSNSEIQELEELCSAAKLRSQDPRMLGTTLFPGETQVSDMVYTFANSDTIASQILVNHGFVFITVLGCIDYASTFNDSAHHQSHFIFELVPFRANGKFHPIRPDEGDVPSAELTLRRSFRAGGFYAD